MPKKKQEEQGQQQQQDDTLSSIFNAIAELEKLQRETHDRELQDWEKLNKVIEMLEKIRDDVANIYAKVDRLESELEKMRKMLYWHKKKTEQGQGHSSKSYYYKKGGNK